jgi:hypothetical protein
LVSQIIKIAESDYAKLPASVRAELDKYTQTTSPVRVFEIPLSIWQPLQQDIRSKFPQAAFEFSGDLSTIWVRILGESKAKAE